MNIVTEKKCRKCGVIKQISEFGKDKQRKDGICTTCKSCRSLHQKEHPVQTRKKVQKYRDANKEKVNAAYREYLKNNKEKENLRHKIYRLLNLEKVKGKEKKYYKNNPEKIRAKSMKRHAAKRGAGGRGVTAEQWIDIVNKYDGKCLCCGIYKKMTMDHVIPLIKGGDHDVNNIQPLCQSCNSKKGVKTIDYRK